MKNFPHIVRKITAAAAGEAYKRGVFDPAGPECGLFISDRDRHRFFACMLDSNIPSVVAVQGWRHSECKIFVALWPTDDAEEKMFGWGPHGKAGEAWTVARLYRGGGWLNYDGLATAPLYVTEGREARLAAFSDLDQWSDPLGLSGRVFA